MLGIDRSQEMLAEARPRAIPGRLEFARAEIGEWTSQRPVDLIVSNAALHWVDNHAALLARLAGLLSRHGTLAVQMPNRFEGPSQTAIEEAAADPRWRSLLQGVGPNRESTRPLLFYVRLLHGLGFEVNAWETTYVHVLTGENPALDWVKGTALRPLLRLDPPAAAEFLSEVGIRLEAIYPPEDGPRGSDRRDRGKSDPLSHAAALLRGHAELTRLRISLQDARREADPQISPIPQFLMVNTRLM